MSSIFHNRHRKRRRKSGLRDVIGIVLGGAIGLYAAYQVLIRLGIDLFK